MKINMKSNLIFLIGILFLIGCQSINIAKENIKIIKNDNHPFLIDHGKMIIVANGAKRINKIEGYPDTGGGCSSHLFEEESKFILIDCNGTIFHIYKRGGKIKKVGWSWMYELPANYVGTFERQKGEESYKFVKYSTIGMEDVYIIKDPNE